MAGVMKKGFDTAHPLVRELVERVALERLPLKHACDRARVSESTVYSWRDRDPTVANLERMLRPLGMKLAIVPDEKRSGKR